MRSLSLLKYSNNRIPTIANTYILPHFTASATVNEKKLSTILDVTYGKSDEKKDVPTVNTNISKMYLLFLIQYLSTLFITV